MFSFSGSTFWVLDYGVHSSLVESFQLAAFGDSFFEYCELRHFSKYYHRASVQ